MRTEDKSGLFSSRKTASCKRKAVGAIYCVLLARFAFRVSRANRLGTRSDPIMGPSRSGDGPHALFELGVKSNFWNNDELVATDIQHAEADEDIEVIAWL